ncbi:MAG: FHA domain-containing protein [Brachybacterium sp.]|nr:FHA domain-containing protein [Brachybacterium sp.]
MSEEIDGEGTTLLGTGTWTKQGPATLVLRENAWVVLVPGLRRQVIEAAWTVLGEKPDPEDFLDKLVEAGELESADKLAALLFGFHDGSRAVFGVKGTTPIAVYTAEGSQQIAGTEDDPFVLRTLDGVRRTAFGDLPLEDGLGAPRLETGIVPVRGFVHVTMDPAELEESERTALAEQVEIDGRSIEDPEVKKRRAERPAPKPAGAPAVTRPAASTETTGGAPSTVPRNGTGSTASTRPGAAPEPAGPNMFDGLFGGGSPVSGPAVSAPQETAALTSSDPAAGAAAEATTAPEQATPPVPASPSPSTATASAPAVDTGGTEAERSPTVGKRRLVSSSLFDRKDRSRPTGADPAAESAPASPGPATANSARPEGEASVADPVPTSTPRAAAAPAAPLRTPPIPTPEPPGDERAPRAAAEDELSSPVTQVAPIDDDGQDIQPGPARHRTPAPHASAPAMAGSDLENSGAYDDLFGKTVFRRIEDAAVRPGEEDDEGAEAEPDTEAASPIPTTSPSSAEPDLEAGPDPEPAQSSAPSEFIDWVPGVGRTAPEIAQTAARRASARPAPEPAYPQVQRVERPPAPNTGSRPAPTRPPMPTQQPAPYERAGWYPPPGGPMNTGAAGQQVGDQSRPGQPPHYPQGPVNPGAAGHHVGFPGPQSTPARGGDPRHHVPGGDAGRNAPAPGWGGSPNPPRPPQYGAADPQDLPRQQGTPSQQGMVPRQNLPPQQSMAPQQDGPPRQNLAPQSRQASVPLAGGAGRSASNTVSLPGLVCADDHPNSPERGSCRACGAPLQGSPRTVARPPLGVVLISGGERFVLDRTAIIGRRPRASRVSGNDVPQLITVPSPQQDISRSHVELRLEGWHVVALDLGTTNGTTLYREGFEPVRLRPREGMVLYDGDLLDLGDDVHLTFGERV